jgi:hypothetical protein
MVSAQPRPSDYRRIHAFGLPDGSVRAILAVALFAIIWVLLVTAPGEGVPDYLRNLLFIIMGHYFATRRKMDPESVAGPGPLFLPRGTIRWVLCAGFVAVAVMLFRGGHLQDPTRGSMAILVLVAGFLLGVMVARFHEWRRSQGHPTPRWVEDLRAAAALLAAAVLIVLVWNRMISHWFPPPELKWGTFGIENVASAVVGFYFGSRS